MNLSKVFYGFTKDGICRCLYKKYKVYSTEYGDVVGTIYMDLENKSEIESTQVDEATLQPITNLVAGRCRTRRKIVNSYKKEFDKKINIFNLFYGNIITFNNMSASNREYNPQKIIVERDVLFKGIGYGIAKNFKTGQDYSVFNQKQNKFKVGEHYVEATWPLARDYTIFNAIQPKRKILEKDYKRGVK